MKIIEKRIYRGPNLYAHFPVIRLTLNLGELEKWPSAKVPGFNDKLIAALPSLKEHTCSYGTPGGFIRRLTENDGTWMGHILEHIAIEVQQLAGAKVTFGKTRSTGETGIYHVVYAYEEERVGMAAMELAMRLIGHLLREGLELPEFKKDEDFNFGEELDELIGFAQRRQLGPSTASLVKAAEERDIPWLRLNDYSLVQFGHGKHQQRVQATITSQTRHIAVEISSDKEETHKILADLGLPVPHQELVRNSKAAIKVAKRIGFPLVIKPYNGNHGRGVTLNIENEEQVIAALENAQKHARTAVMETMIAGFDHRMLVVDGKLVAVSKRVPGHVVGDGKKTIAELIDIVNSDPRRGIGHEKVLTRIELDYQAQRLLEAAEYNAETVLKEGEIFYLRSTGNLSTGGTAIDMTDEVHPDNQEMAMRAAKAVGLDVAGVDFITPDVTRSYKDLGGAICEINAAPGFRMHVAPTEGKPRDVAGPVMDMLFPPNTPARIPMASVTGTNGKTTTARMLAHMHKMSGCTVGLATTDGVYIDGVRTVEGDMTGPKAAQMILRDPDVDMAVLETARGGLVRSGLGFRTCNVGAVLNVASDHLGLRGIDTLEDLAAVKRIVPEVARDCAVLNADDMHCLKMADHTKAKRIAYFTMNPRNDLVRQHIQAGGLAAVLEEGINGHMITLYDDGAHMPLLWTHLIPATMEGKALHNVANAMAAAVMAYAMDVKMENIRQGLRTFDTSYFQVPGRLNIFNELPFKVILDYGHNASAIKCMVDLVERLDAEGKKICVLAAPGDRRNEDILEIAKVAAQGNFDKIIVRRDDNPRGRDEAEVPQLLHKGLKEAGYPESQIELIVDEQEAVNRALQLGEHGDLILIFGDKISRCWKQITKFKDQSENLEQTESSESMSNVIPLTINVNTDNLHLDAEVISDARGVRIARELSD
ncbi:MAG: cyanophycin synthetase [Myxococcota bacterium]|jgi:cyanophycin synthetase|nr:cyanophycin synthetase [Myxococcota bacterium]